MPQTRFVTRKALALGLRPIVAINKIDRSDAEPLRVHDEVLGLFIDLEATHEQLDAPFLYTSSRAGTATTDLERAGHRPRRRCSRPSSTTCPAPTGDPEGPFQMLVSTLDYSPFLGRHRHRPDRARPGARSGDPVAVLPLGEPGPGAPRSRSSESRVTRLYTFDGLARIEVERGARRRHRASSPASRASRSARRSPIRSSRSGCWASRSRSPPSRWTSSSTTRPFAGREGKYVTSRQVRDRLFRELERNVALRVEETDYPRYPHGVGTRRAAPRHPDGDDAARGVRVPGVPAPGDHPGGRRRRAAGAVRGADDRRARGATWAPSWRSWGPGAPR